MHRRTTYLSENLSDEDAYRVIIVCVSSVSLSTSLAKSILEGQSHFALRMMLGLDVSTSSTRNVGSILLMSISFASMLVNVLLRILIFKKKSQMALKEDAEEVGSHALKGYIAMVRAYLLSK